MTQEDAGPMLAQCWTLKLSRRSVYMVNRSCSDMYCVSLFFIFLLRIYQLSDIYKDEIPVLWTCISEIKNRKFRLYIWPNW